VQIAVDFDAPSHRDFVAFAAELDTRADQKVHAHCAANFRVSVFYALYATERGFCSGAEADELVHDLWNPGDHPAWVRFIAEERSEPSHIS
jgi:hypothetical protein